MKIFSAQLKGTTIVVEGATASLTGSFTGSIAGIDINSTNTFTASTIARLNSIETISSSNDGRVGNIELFTSSTSARLNSIETITSSNLSRLNSLEEKTGSLATTGSNTFYGTQTITGSLYISSDLIVQGSSSLQNITASAVSIGTNLINLNTANPAIRYAGLVIGDSGSVGGSGSFLYDSVQDEMIFVHRGASVAVTSSVVLMGPQTYDSVGNEIYPTSNYIQKGTGNEHLADSCIWEMSGSMGINTSSPAVSLHVDASGGGIIRATRLGSGVGYIQLEADGTNGTLTSSNGLLINTGGSQRVNITSTGIACFSCQICANSFIGGTLGLSTTTADYAATITNVQDSSQGLLIRATDNDTSLCLLSLQGSAGATSQTWVDRFVVTKDGTKYFGNPAGSRFQMNASGENFYQYTNSYYIWGLYNDANNLSIESAFSGNIIFRTGAQTTASSPTTTTERMRITSAGTFGLNCSGIAARTFVVKGASGCSVVAEFIEPAGVHSVLLYPNRSGYNHISSDYLSGGVYLPLSLSGRENNTDFVLTTNGDIGIGTNCRVNGSGYSNALAIQANTLNTWGLVEVRGYSNTNGGELHLGGNTDIYATLVGEYVSSGNGNLYIRTRKNGTICNAAVITSAGNLDVTGAISSKGTLTNYGTGTDTYTVSTWYVDTTNQILFENGRTTNSASGTGRTVYFTWRGGPSVGGGVQLQHGSNAWSAYTSDARMKTKVADVSNGVEAIMKLNPIKFKWTRELENSKTITGFTAQNIEEAIPDAVFNSWKDDVLGDVKSYYQDYLNPYLVKAIQEQQCTINILKSCLGIN